MVWLLIIEQKRSRNGGRRSQVAGADVAASNEHKAGRGKRKEERGFLCSCAWRGTN